MRILTVSLALCLLVLGCGKSPKDVAQEEALRQFKGAYSNPIKVVNLEESIDGKLGIVRGEIETELCGIAVRRKFEVSLREFDTGWKVEEFRADKRMYDSNPGSDGPGSSFAVTHEKVWKAAIDKYFSDWKKDHNAHFSNIYYDEAAREVGAKDWADMCKHAAQADAEAYKKSVERLAKYLNEMNTKRLRYAEDEYKRKNKK